MYLTKLRSLDRKLTKEDALHLAITVSLALLISCVGNAMLNLSMRSFQDVEFIDSYGNTAQSKPLGFISAVILVFLILMAFFSISKSLVSAAWISSTLFFITSLVNYFTLILHGTMFSIEELKNTLNAARALRGYHLVVSAEFWQILALFISLAFVLLILSILKLLRKPRQPLFAILWLLLSVESIWLIFGSEYIIKDTNPWSWEKYSIEHSYLIGFIRYSIENGKATVRRPDTYDTAVIRRYENAGLSSDTNQRPDIIFILNETYYNCDHIARTDSDVDYMENFKALNADKGYAFVPSFGGTNSSEYELLTSNSMSLLNSSSPFNSMDMTGQNSIVSFLKELGYATMAAHPEAGANYHRVDAWKDMGFETCYFRENFQDLNYSGERVRATDSSVFRNFTRFYEAMPEDRPRFAYLLTIQNHGGWLSNPDDLDTVHVGENTPWAQNASTCNEFLSSIQLTDAFIQDITDYFSELYRNTGRKAVVLMVGDHSPYFINSIIFKYPFDNGSLSARLRQTPYFVWRSDSEEKSSMEDLDTLPVMDLCCLSPYIATEAGLPLSPYYVLLNTLRQRGVAFTNVESEEGEIGYLDAQETYHSLIEGGEISDLIQDYFCLEYNNIGDSDRCDTLFTPP